MGRNRISTWMTVGLLCVTGCSKTPDFKTTRKRLIENQTRQSSYSELVDPEMPQILPGTHYASGRMFETQGNVAKAIEQYQKAIAVSHNHVPSFHRLGLIYSKLGQHDEGIEMFRKAVILNPDNAVLRNNLGFELMFKKEWSDAAKQLSTAIALEPRFARAHINMGMTLSKLERYDDALAHFRAVLPEPDAQYNLGLMYRAAQKYADAAAAFQCVLDADPNFKAAQTQLADITPLIPIEPETGANADDAKPSFAANDPLMHAAPTAPKPQPSTKTPERVLAAKQPPPIPVLIAPTTSRATVVAVQPDGDGPESSDRPQLDPPGPTHTSVHDPEVEIAIAPVAIELEEPCEQDVLEDAAVATIDGTPPAATRKTRDVVENRNNDAATAAEPIVEIDPVAAMPSVQLYDEVARIDEKIRCMVDEAIEQMAVAASSHGWRQPMRIDPVLAELDENDYVVGNFIEDKHSEPIVAISWDEWDDTAGRDWRVRLRTLTKRLQNVRSEIGCLEEVDTDLASTRQGHSNRSMATNATAERKAVTVANKRAKRNRSVKRTGANSPMTLAYKPVVPRPVFEETPSQHAAPVLAAEPAAHQPLPQTIARPGDVYEAHAVVEAGPAFPLYGIEPPSTARPQAPTNWDAQFADLRDLMAITQNELRCREEGSLEDEHNVQITESSEPAKPEKRGRATPVRLKGRRNPFNRR